MSDLSLADLPYGPKFNLNCEVLVEKQINSIAYEKGFQYLHPFFQVTY